MFKKITEGCVVQTFDDKGNCISQEFIAGEPVEFETEDGKIMCHDDVTDEDNAYLKAYYPFNMEQPQV